MNRFLVPIIAFALLVVVLAVGIRRAPDKGIIKSVLIGKPAPEFLLPLLGSSQPPFDSRSLRGQPWILNVWGTWCAECRAEHSSLMQIAKSGGIALIGLNWKDEDALALQWLEQLGNPYRVVAADRDGRVAIDYGVYGAPESFLIDARGIVSYKHVGALTSEVWQLEFVPRLAAATQTVAASEARP